MSERKAEASEGPPVEGAEGRNGGVLMYAGEKEKARQRSRSGPFQRPTI